MLIRYPTDRQYPDIKSGYPAFPYSLSALFPLSVKEAPFGKAIKSIPFLPGKNLLREGKLTFTSQKALLCSQLGIGRIYDNPG